VGTDRFQKTVAPKVFIDIGRHAVIRIGLSVLRVPEVIRNEISTAALRGRTFRDRTPSILGHELAGVVTALGYGTTGLPIGQRVFGLSDWYRDGTLAEYIAVESRNLAPLPGDVDFTVGVSPPISGLTAWQGLFQHGRLQAAQTVLAHGAAGAVGSIVTQLAREAGAYVIGPGRAADRQKALDFGANEFVDLGNDSLEDVGGVDLVFDVIGGDVQKRSAALIGVGERL
jgi:NADPH:quinone reductase-like Zn-dependent oxidoreductase